MRSVESARKEMWRPIQKLRGAAKEGHVAEQPHRAGLCPAQREHCSDGPWSSGLINRVKRQTGKCAELWYKCVVEGEGGPEALTIEALVLVVGLENEAWETGALKVRWMELA